MSNTQLFAESLKSALDTPLQPTTGARLTRLIDELGVSLLADPWWIVEARAREIALGAASLAMNGDPALVHWRLEGRLDGPSVPSVSGSVEAYPHSAS